MQLKFAQGWLVSALCGGALLSAALSLFAAPQRKTLPAGAKTVAAKVAWKLKLSNEPPYLVSLKAEKAPVTEIAAALGRRLNIPALLSPVIRQQRVTVDISDAPLESALLRLAPQPYIDYELSGDPAVQPKLISLYLHALNEPPPSALSIVKGDAESILIEGDTEEGMAEGGEKKKEEEPLRVTLDKNGISLRAKQQPLVVVLHEIALKVDIPFEMKYESSEIVDGEFNNYTMEQLVRSLSPNIRLYQRTDLSTSATRPLRLVLVPPANAQPTTKM
ncbi:hypothetical protein BH18ACI2_BH18ACI2_04270 [soil metagenome]